MSEQDHKAEYEQACDMAAQATAFVALQRCCNCAHQTASGNCATHGEVPEPYRFAPNECAQWEANIPF